MSLNTVYSFSAFFCNLLMFSTVGVAQCGFIDRDGQVVVKPIYDTVDSFSAGYAVVEKDGKCGYINTNGDVVIPLKFVYAASFSSGLAAVAITEKGQWKYGFIDKRGNYAIPPRSYGEVRDFEDGMAPVLFGNDTEDMSTKRPLWGFINRAGAVVVDAKFNDARSFSGGFAGVKVGDKWTFINRRGKMISKPRFDGVFAFSDGLARVLIGKQWGFLDTNGTLAIKASFNSVDDFSCGLAYVEHSEGACFIDKRGKIRFYASYNTGSFSEGLAEVSGRNSGFIDRSGKLVIESQFAQRFYGFHEGLAAIATKGRYGFINSRGKVVIPPRFGDVLDFSEGRAAFSLKQHWTAVITSLPQKPEDDKKQGKQGK